ncbi:hypothetical protein [Legionella spiritensis]|uniref:LPG0439 HIT-related domain-containing protein n=1 Tax=Legionella spiritensis TaxID=452 RepID=A0A0W0YW21_LEGSP|nr:hypothetical protein [Legionella spiritensis]KTD61109.1 hypothetical protein Lspi_2729 [Legionella spiritensis]SNV44952.1 Uncharacterised protein [Legionella spiritensis]
MALVKQTILGLLLSPWLFTSGFAKPPASGKIYYQGNYLPGHWALQPYVTSDPKVVALACFKRLEYAIYLNPTDERGYRSIVTLINNKDMRTVMNRDYSSLERIGLGILVQMMAQTYSRITPVSQTAMMGNNCHGYDSDTGTTYLGTAREPCLLHAHIMGRGNPNVAYVAGVVLNGPKPGVAFLFKSKDPNVPGNDKSVAWKKGEMEKVVRRLRLELGNIQSAYARHGITLVMPSPDSTTNNSACSRHGGDAVMRDNAQKI